MASKALNIARLPKKMISDEYKARAFFQGRREK
jgi:hypothetical protein